MDDEAIDIPDGIPLPWARWRAVDENRPGPSSVAVILAVPAERTGLFKQYLCRPDPSLVSRAALRARRRLHTVSIWGVHGIEQPRLGRSCAYDHRHANDRFRRNQTLPLVAATGSNVPVAAILGFGTLSSPRPKAWSSRVRARAHVRDGNCF